MMLVLVWLVIISIVQDYTWVLLGVPEATHVEGTTKKKDEVEQTESKGSNKDEKAASEEEEDKEDERSTAIEVTAVADGDDIWNLKKKKNLNLSFSKEEQLPSSKT